MSKTLKTLSVIMAICYLVWLNVFAIIIWCGGLFFTSIGALTLLGSPEFRLQAFVYSAFAILVGGWISYQLTRAKPVNAWLWLSAAVCLPLLTPAVWIASTIPVSKRRSVYWEVLLTLFCTAYIYKLIETFCFCFTPYRFSLAIEGFLFYPLYLIGPFVAVGLAVDWFRGRSAEAHQSPSMQR